MKKLKCGAVGPLKVVKNQKQRLLFRDSNQCLEKGREHLVSLLAQINSSLIDALLFDLTKASHAYHAHRYGIIVSIIRSRCLIAFLLIIVHPGKPHRRKILGVPRSIYTTFHVSLKRVKDRKIGVSIFLVQAGTAKA